MKNFDDFRKYKSENKSDNISKMINSVLKDRLSNVDLSKVDEDILLPIISSAARINIEIMYSLLEDYHNWLAIQE